MPKLQIANDAFEKALEKTLRNEGGTANVTHDKGGTTNHGISKAFLEKLSGGPVSSAYVLSLKMPEVIEIYRSHFWLKPKFQRIPFPALREAVFDQGVNRGPASAVKDLQRAIMKLSGLPLAIDGDIGPKTLSALEALDEDALLLSFMRESQMSYLKIVQSDHSQVKFLIGWIARTWTYKQI